MLGAVVAVWLCAALAPSVASARTVEYGYWEPTVVPNRGSMYQWMDGVRPEGVATNRFLSPEDFSSQARRMAAGWSYANRGTGYSAYDITKGTEVLTDIKTVATTSGNIATLRQLKAEGLSLMERMKSFGVLRALGDVALGVTSFEVGYWVGEQVADFFFGSSPEETLPPVSTQFIFKAYSPVGAGENLCAFSYEGITTGACAAGGHMPAPVPLMVFKWRSSTNSGTSDMIHRLYSSSQGSACPSDKESWSYSGAPEAGVSLSMGDNPCGSGGPQPNTERQIEVMPVEVSCLPGEAGCSPKETRSGGAMPGAKTATETEADAKECLEGRTCRLMPGAWWNHDPEVQQATVVIPGTGVDLEPAEPLEVRIPEPLTGESYKAYDERLEALELKPEPIVLAESAIDPEVGPEEVASVKPGAETQVAPGTSVRVRYNPADAPEATGAPGGGFVPPAIPSIDFTPLTETGLGCGTFPFGIFCWFAEAVEIFAVSPHCPLSVSLPIGAPFGSTDQMAVNGCSTAETVMSPLRLVILACATIGLVLLFGKQAMGTGGGDA